MSFKFDLQLFGGGGSSTTVNESKYTPSEYELQLQKAQANYADAIAPNSLWLNDTARKVLQDSLGTVQVDYNKMNQNAQSQISGAQNGYSGLASNLSGTSTPNYGTATCRRPKPRQKHNRNRSLSRNPSLSPNRSPSLNLSRNRNPLPNLLPRKNLSSSCLRPRLLSLRRI